jgi:uncharacterized protein YbdZ (MbtH family)
VKNQEGQYAIWSVELDVPAGWETQAPQASKEDCVQHIRENWTDMRPKQPETSDVHYFTLSELTHAEFRENPAVVRTAIILVDDSFAGRRLRAVDLGGQPPERTIAQMLAHVGEARAGLVMD